MTAADIAIKARDSVPSSQLPGAGRGTARGEGFGMIGEISKVVVEEAVLLSASTTESDTV